MDSPLIAICAWCLQGQPPTLTVLDGTPPELALLAIEAEEGLTHGICEIHRQQALEQAGLR